MIGPHRIENSLTGEITIVFDRATGQRAHAKRRRLDEDMFFSSTFEDRHGGMQMVGLARKIFQIFFKFSMQLIHMNFF